MIFYVLLILMVLWFVFVSHQDREHIYSGKSYMGRPVRGKISPGTIKFL